MATDFNNEYMTLLVRAVEIEDGKYCYLIRAITY